MATTLLTILWRRHPGDAMESFARAIRMLFVLTLTSLFSILSFPGIVSLMGQFVISISGIIISVIVVVIISLIINN